MFKLYVFTSIFSMFYFLSFSQEVNDSTNLNFEYDEALIVPMLFDDEFFYKYYPLSGVNNVQVRMNSMIFNELTDIPKYQQFSYNSKGFYQYQNNGFSYWQNNIPLALGIRFSFKEALGWDKFDLFFDANGTMINNFDLTSMGVFMIPDHYRSFYWEAGAGVGYEFSPGKTFFIKSSAMFMNKKYIGQKNVGGLNMTF